MFGEGVSFRIRGLSATLSIDGMRTSTEPNSYNFERVASARGPSERRRPAKRPGAADGASA